MTLQQKKLFRGLCQRYTNLCEEGSDIFFQMFPFLETPGAKKVDDPQLEAAYNQNNKECRKVLLAIVDLLDEIYPKKKNDIVREIMSRGDTQMTLDK